MFSLPVLVFSLFLANDSVQLARAEDELSVDIGVHELRAHVYRLSSPDFMGRRGSGARRAARHLVAAFERLHLQPAFGKSYYQSIPWLLADESKKDTSFVGQNVGAMLPGTDPKLKDEWVLLCAHYDHLGERKGKLYPGADDNASGVAMLLEVAERYALQKEKPRRTVLFVAFDQEEAGLLGSTHFAAHPPRSFTKLKASLTADMLGRSMLGVMDEYVFVLGSESSTRLRKLIEEIRPEKGLKIGRMGADLIGSRSDYGPFRDRHAPFLFFSTGTHVDYHRPTDLPDRLDYDKMRKIALWISDLTWHLANDDQAPSWEDKAAPDLEEVRTIWVMVKRVLTNPQAFQFTKKQWETVSEVEARLAAILQRGQMTASERTWLVWTGRFLMATIF